MTCFTVDTWLYVLYLTVLDCNILFFTVCFRRRTHLVDVHTEINGMIFDHNRKSPGAIYHINLRHTLRKNLYLQ